MSITNSSYSSIDSVSAAIVPSIDDSGESGEFAKIFPSTEAQLEIWLSSKQGVEANCAYNEITSLKLEGNLDLVALKSALQLLVKRHDSLRSTFSADGERMQVSRNSVFEFNFVDFSEFDRDEADIKRLNLVQDQACSPFDLEQGPLFRVVLQKLADQVHYLTLSAHHIVLDGWSLAVVVRDLGHLYDEEKGVASEPLPSTTSYEEYSALMDKYFASTDAESDKQFWLNEFSDGVPVLDLPIHGNRPSLRNYFARRYDHVLNAELIESLRKLGAKSGCSIFNTMLAAFEVFVTRISGNHDFCIGIPTAGQLAMEQPELVGHCVNTMPMRAKVDTGGTFAEQLKTTRSKLLDSFEHQRYTFGKILKDVSPRRDPSRPPMVAISFNVDPCVDCKSVGFDGLDVRVYVEPRLFENFEWFINGIINDDKSIELQVQYNTDLFSAEFLKQLLTGFEEFLLHLVNNPQQRLSSIPVISIEQRQKMLVDWNDTECDFGAGKLLHEEFERQAKATPNRIAVKFKDRQYSYSELDAKSNQFANYLIQQKVSADELIGVCVPRNEKMLYVLLGILKAGAGYVPLDPSFPQDRLQYMSDHSELKLVVGTQDVEELVASFDKPSVILEKVETELAAMSEKFDCIEASPRSTCYVIYTSGSTGTPKGVEIPHGAVVNFLHSMAEKPGFGPDDSILAVTTLSFDIAVLELYLPLIVGGTTVVASKAITSDGQLIVDAINENNVTLFQSTPASLRLMIAAGWEGKSNLKVLCGGEPMPTDLVAPLLERCNELWNMYGPTETTVWSSVFNITDADAPILIGKPIGNTQIYVLDSNFQPVPVGAVGEIFIGGAGVTLGYLNQKEMTNERFVNNPYFNPFVDYCSHRLYRTGDLGRFKSDGNIQFLRRNDKQVKVRGFRIELGEIETAIKAIDEVDQAVVIVREDVPGDTRLVAYWVGARDSETGTSRLRDLLRESLPYYMIPQHFVQLDLLPQTNNGKIDFKSLPKPASSVDDDSDELKPKTEIQELIANVWKEVLNVDEIFINDNFFDLGGHSLLVMKVISAIEEETGARLSPPDFLIGTLEQLADKVSGQGQVNDKVVEPAPTKKPVAEKTPVAEIHEETQLEDVATKEVVSENSKGIFKRLTGFWD